MLFSAPAMLLGLLAGGVSAFCGTSHPSEDGHAILSTLQAKESAALQDSQTLKIRQSGDRLVQVYGHLIRISGSDASRESDLRRQIDVLNQVFQGSGFTFNLTGYDAPVIADLRDLGPLQPGSQADETVKQYRQGGAGTLNIYIVPEGATGPDGIAGYATFPWNYNASPRADGVVMDQDFIPGGRAAGYNSGKICSHEAGHWLGLLHTFQGGCFAPNDYVDDTPGEASPASGCPEGRDTCASPGQDPIHNHMDYSNDACRTGFTPGQIRRMHAAAQQFRGL